jgi:soluble P-type ATPase
MAKTMSRRETRQALKEIPIEEILRVNKSELTTKQKAFAKAVAMGNTGADAYRQAYDTSGSVDTIGNNASRLKADSRIKAEIEAYQLAIEAGKYRSSEALRSLVLHSLTQVLIDPETKPAQKIQAARVLGQVTEINLFTERKEITHINGSDEIKSQIMAQLKTLMLGNGNTDITDVDSADLLAELSDFDSKKPIEDVILTTDETHYTGTDPNKKSQSLLHLHTIPPEVSPIVSEIEIRHNSDSDASTGEAPLVFPDE